MTRTLVSAVVPTLLALVVTAFAALERASVDTAVSAGRLGASFLPVWYVPLAVFATAHVLCRMMTMPGRTAASTAVGVGAAALALAFHLAAGPFYVGEFIYGFALVFAVIFPPIFFLLPIAAAAAIGTAGALYGLSIHVPLALARRIAPPGSGSTEAPGVRMSLVVAGVIVALVCIAHFGVPTDAARGARGNYYFSSNSASAIWLHAAPAIALCCVAVVVASALHTPAAYSPTAGRWIAWFALPVGVALGAGGYVLTAIQSSAALDAIRALPVIEPVSRYFRDGRPRADAPIRFAGGELRIDRGLVGYLTADNPQRRIVTVAMRPPPELEALGVRGRIILNGWRAEPHSKEAEYRKTPCAESASRLVLECRLPSNGAVVIEIDRERPELGLQRRVAGPDPGCLVIITSAGGRALSIRAELDCALTDDWPRRAAEIERYFIARHIVP